MEVSGGGVRGADRLNCRLRQCRGVAVEGRDEIRREPRGDVRRGAIRGETRQVEARARERETRGSREGESHVHTQERRGRVSPLYRGPRRVREPGDNLSLGTTVYSSICCYVFQTFYSTLHQHRRTSCKAWVGSSLPK